MSGDLDGTFVRFCPTCRGEFVATVEICHDCGTALETRLADPALAFAPRPAGPPSPDPVIEPPTGWVAIQSAELDWARELSERLRDAGVGTRLVPECGSCRPELSVFVSPTDLQVANRVAHQLYVERVPEAGDTAVPTDTDRCPACGTGLSEEAARCPDCGLEFLPLDSDGG